MVHHAVGKETPARLDVGFKFHPKGYVPTHQVGGPGGIGLAFYDMLDFPAGEAKIMETFRRTSAHIGKQLGRKALAEVAAIVRPDTIRAWHRRLVAKTFDGSTNPDAPSPHRGFHTLPAQVLDDANRAKLHDGGRGIPRRPSVSDPRSQGQVLSGVRRHDQGRWRHAGG